MSKRRNPKKEKALRNRAYARQFRKRKSNDRFSRNRWSRSSNRPQEQEEDESNNNNASEQT